MLWLLSSSTQTTFPKVCSMVVLLPPLEPPEKVITLYHRKSPERSRLLQGCRMMKLPHLPRARTFGCDTHGCYYRPGWGGWSPRTHLQDPAADVPVAGLTLDAELGMVVGLTVWDAIPSGEGGEGGEGR